MMGSAFPQCPAWPEWCWPRHCEDVIKVTQQWEKVLLQSLVSMMTASGLHKPVVLPEQPNGQQEGACSQGDAHGAAPHPYALPAPARSTLLSVAGRAPAHGHRGQGQQSHHSPSRKAEGRL